jgi:microcin C transport system ATP-binding protein
MTLLTVNHLNVSASTPLVKDVSFTLEAGEVLALVGESGSGKTLTALSIIGLLPAGLTQSGEVKLAGQQGSPIKGLDIGMIFQEPMTSLNPLHTIAKQIGEAIEIHQPAMSRQQVVARTQELLDRVGLSHFKHRLDAYPHQLSGGERQRVMIAMAISNNPKLLIADEPTTALDVTIQAQILEVLATLCRTLNMSVLLITHDLSIVRRVAGRVAIMSQGELVEMGKTKDIFSAPQHAYTKRLLAAEPQADAPAMPANAPVLMECRDLGVSFAVNKGIFTWKTPTRDVLQDVTVSVPQGGTLGIVGESGSGKTTLALALLRLTPSKGSIHFAGEILDGLQGNALRAKRRDMQIVFQDPFASLNPRMMVGDIIGEGLGVHEPQLSDNEQASRVSAILQEVGLTPDMRERYPHQFSGGQRQRISIARALILKPKLIVLDEPTSALDVSVQAQILGLLKDLQRKHGLSYIFISHDLRVVRAMSHRIVVLRGGKVVEAGDTIKVFANPQQDYTRTLMDSALS